MNASSSEPPGRRPKLARFLLTIIATTIPAAVAMIFFDLENSLALALMMLPSMILAMWLVDPEDFGMEGPKFLYRR